MATEVVNNRTFIATSSLATKQYCFVKMDTSGGIVLCGSAGRAIGVLQDKPGAGDPGAVCSPGDLTKILLGDTVTAGATLISDADGHAIAGGSAGSNLGIARSAGDAGDVITMLFMPYQLG
jgi:hypothetical protein